MQLAIASCSACKLATVGSGFYILQPYAVQRCWDVYHGRIQSNAPYIVCRTAVLNAVHHEVMQQLLQYTMQCIHAFALLLLPSRFVGWSRCMRGKLFWLASMHCTSRADAICRARNVCCLGFLTALTRQQRYSQLVVQFSAHIYCSTTMWTGMHAVLRTLLYAAPMCLWFRRRYTWILRKGSRRRGPCCGSVIQLLMTWLPYRMSVTYLT